MLNKAAVTQGFLSTRARDAFLSSTSLSPKHSEQEDGARQTPRVLVLYQQLKGTNSYDLYVNTIVRN